MAISLIRTSRPPETSGAVGSNPEQGGGLLSDDKYRELLQKILNEALSYSQGSDQIHSERGSAWNLLSGLQSLGAEVNAVVNGAAAAVEKKVAELSTAMGGQSDPRIHEFLMTKSTDEALEIIARSSEQVREELYSWLANREANNGEMARARQIVTDHIANPFQRRQMLSSLDQQEVQRALGKGKAEEALKLIAALPSARERANKLLQAVQQIGPGQKRAVAMNLLEQARSMLSPSVQAEDQDQMRALFEIARGFSRYDSKRSFEIVEPLIDQLNEICGAAKIMEGFGGEYFDDDELNLNNGNTVASLADQMSNVLGTLALTSFDRAKLASDRIRLPEVRLRAYMSIAVQTIRGGR